MDEGKKTPGISGILKSPRLWHAIRVIAITAVLAYAALFFIDRAVNPTWINHLVIIREDQVEYRAPFRASLRRDGTRDEVVWVQDVFVGRGSPDGHRSLVVSNVAGAWTGGLLTITDDDGQQLANVEVQQPGRYCGTLVILIDPKGESHTAWNSMPLE